MRPLLHEAGHILWTPSYTGMGERGHRADPSIDLNTHIQDVVGLLEFEDLTSVVVIGHSYGGMVATGVADRARERVAQIVYLDAFAPEDGQSAFDLMSPQARETLQRRASESGDNWKVAPNPMPPDTPDADLAWAAPRRLPQPIKTFETPLVLTQSATPPERSYIYCLRTPPGDTFGPSAARAQREGWRYFEIDASHNPHITAPDELAALLREIVD